MLDVQFALTWNYKGQRGKETLFHTGTGNLVTQLRDWSPAFRSMKDEVLAPGVDEQFTTAGHGEWAQLAPSTIKQKGNDTILFRTGHMFRSFQTGAPDHIEEISRDRMIWGTSDPKAIFHQTGTGSGFQVAAKGPGRGVPMRKMLKLTEDMRRQMRSALVRQLATIARREGYAIMGGLDIDPLTARQVGAEALGI